MLLNLLYYRLLFSAVVLESHHRFVNLSRVDPAIVSTGFNGSKCFHRPGSPTPIIFTSVIYVSTCDLITPKSVANSKPVKSISGAFLEGEWERFVGAIGMVIWEREFKGQLFKDNLSFTTSPQMDGTLIFLVHSILSFLSSPLTDDCPGNTPASPTKSTARSVYSGRPSAFTRTPGATTQKTTLSCSDNGMFPLCWVCRNRSPRLHQFPSMMVVK
jgi:hypothetical protein